MLVEALRGSIRVLYHVLDGRPFEHARDTATVRGFVFEPDAEAERTVAFVHGLGDASTTWLRQVRGLRQDARLVLVDLPPFGRSKLADGYALGPDEHARLLAPIVAEHAVGPTTVVGQSMGGWVTQWLLHERPDLADAALLVAPAGTRLEGSYDAVGLMTPHDAEGARRYLEAVWHEVPLAAPAVLDHMLERMHDPVVRGFLAETEHRHTVPEEALAAIDVPTLALWGSDDGLLDGRTPAYLARQWGGPFERTYLARAGHMIHQERPQAVEAAVRRMMRVAEQV
ncbi:hypothetical protein BRD56_00310 [Thermoplasmatales archaeon SW_10_69_26]|nr:MAG: hypothetical protein BRD56_00310 [Thermoplasmatales archaeon SW_10_69_26]